MDIGMSCVINTERNQRLLLHVTQDKQHGENRTIQSMYIKSQRDTKSDAKSYAH